MLQYFLDIRSVCIKFLLVGLVKKIVAKVVAAKTCPVYACACTQVCEREFVSTCAYVCVHACMHAHVCVH